MLTLIFLALVAMLCLFIYGGRKISQDSKTVTNQLTTKTDKFNQEINTINKNLTKINQSLKQKASSISNLIPSGL